MCGDDFHRPNNPRHQWGDPGALDHDKIWAAVVEAAADETLDYFIYEGFKAMTTATAISYKL